MLKRIGLLLVGSALACGGPDAQAPSEYESTSESIINGQSCGPDESPEAVAILPRLNVKQGSQRGSMDTIACTGTLIAPDVVMAAGHCVDESLYRQEAAQYGFTLESVDYFISYRSNLTSLVSSWGASIPEDAVPVIRTEAHPGYSLEGFGVGPQKLNDISVLFLDTVQSVKPAVVITASEVDQVMKNADVQIVGWGQQSPDSQTAVVGAKRCATSFINELGQWEMQIGGSSSTSRKCHGDSGGPTFMDVETTFNNKRRVIGITSHAYDQSDCQKGGVDTRVDAYLTWLDETLTAACEDGTRVWCDVKGLVPPEFYEPPIDPNGNDPVDNGGGSDTDDSRRIKRSNCATGGVSMLSLAALAGLFRRRSRR